jgi:hypothetical protein
MLRDKLGYTTAIRAFPTGKFIVYPDKILDTVSTILLSDGMINNIDEAISECTNNMKCNLIIYSPDTNIAQYRHIKQPGVVVSGITDDGYKLYKVIRHTQYKEPLSRPQTATHPDKNMDNYVCILILLILAISVSILTFIGHHNKVIYDTNTTLYNIPFN